MFWLSLNLLLWCALGYAASCRAFDRLPPNRPLALAFALSSLGVALFIVELALDGRDRFNPGWRERLAAVELAESLHTLHDPVK